MNNTIESFKASIEVSHDCPYCHLTKQYPEARIAIWCNTRSHVIEVLSNSRESLDTIEKKFTENVDESHCFRYGPLLSVISLNCDCDVGTKSISSLITESQCWYIPPAIFQGGWEFYTVISWHRNNIATLIRSIKEHGGTVKLKSIKAIELPGYLSNAFIPTYSLIAGMTMKQIDTLVEAFQTGYFETPSRIDTERLATRLGISRSTCTEHLRKAEAKLLANLFPVLKMASREKTIAKERNSEGKIKDSLFE
jgi:predicted DNA binding protein